jgi:hypothetical protein
MQKLVHASSWPVLTLGSGNMNDNHEHLISFGLRNAGIGPARIHSFDFLVDEKPVHARWLIKGIIEACCADALKAAMARAGGDDHKAFGDDYSTPIARTFLSPNEEKSALGWPRTEGNAALWDAVDEARKKGRILTRACYCSVFDECWVAEPGAFPPREVAKCREE